MIVHRKLMHRLSMRTQAALLATACLVLPLSTFATDDQVTPGSNDGRRAINLALTVDTAAQDETAATKPSSQRGGQQNGPLIKNSSFDEFKTYSVGVPWRPGHWGGDKAEIVTSEQGIAPNSGDHMLRFLGSGANGCSKGYTSCEVMQLIEIDETADFKNEVYKANVSLQVNRVHRNAQTDTVFNVTAYAFSGSPSQFHSRLISDTTLGEASAYIYADSDPHTWESINVSMRIPAGTSYIALRISAGENVSDDGDDEFHGHYLDDVNVSLTHRPATRSRIPAFQYRRRSGLNGIFLRSDASDSDPTPHTHEESR